MKKILSAILIILIIASCGGPNYPDQPPIPPPDKLQEKAVEPTPDFFETDTLNYISSQAKYYQQVRPILVSVDGNSIFVDGNEFRILEQIDTLVNGFTVVACKVQAISGSLNNIEQIITAYKGSTLVELSMPPLGIFAKDTPTQWILNNEQKKAQEKKIVETDKITKTHVVGTGDNLNDIAKQYHMNLKQLIELNRNQLTRNGKISSIIRPGQKLKVYEKN